MTSASNPPAVGGLTDPILARRDEIQRVTLARLGRRKRVSRAVAALCALAVVIVMIPLVAVLGYTLKRGIKAWSVAFFTNLPTPAGIPGGGIHNAIIGTLIIDAMAALMAVPVGVGTALYLARSNGRVGGALRFGADVLAGIPSIVIGIFAYTVLVVTLGHFSAISASFALAVLMLPIIVRASEIALRSVPVSLLEAGAALAMRESTVTWRVALPVALPGVVTGVLLGVARAAGETAPLLFTAIGSQYWSISLTKPIAAMPLVIFLNGIQAYPDLQQVAWGTALALIVIVLVLNIAARLWTARMRRSMR
jgi:phosphate transport system permease protein